MGGPLSEDSSLEVPPLLCFIQERNISGMLAIFFL
jgi:hypothetical protein